MIISVPGAVAGGGRMASAAVAERSSGMQLVNHRCAGELARVGAVGYAGPERLPGGRVVVGLGPGSSLAGYEAVGSPYIRAATSRAGVPNAKTWPRALATWCHNDQFRTHWKRSSDDGVPGHWADIACFTAAWL
jgi:hypothetical protein